MVYYVMLKKFVYDKNTKQIYDVFLDSKVKHNLAFYNNMLKEEESLGREVKIVLNRKCIYSPGGAAIDSGKLVIKSVGFPKDHLWEENFN